MEGMEWSAHISSADRRVYRALASPAKIQAYLDDKIDYNKRPQTCWGPHLVLKNRAGHCMEGALFAAAALRFLGHEPTLVDLVAVRDDDHVLAVFREHGCWGAIAKSNYSGLRFRNPVYRTIRELAMSYFEHYYNPRGEKTLRAYSRPIGLAQFDRLNWVSTAEEVWQIPDYLCAIEHTPVLPAAATGARVQYRMDRRLYEAGRLGMRK
jgi:hypothetical protein